MANVTVPLDPIDVEAESPDVALDDEFSNVEQRVGRLLFEADPAHDIPISKEIATLEVRNKLFTNWNSIRIEQRVAEAFPTFQFEQTEESPICEVGRAAIRSGDICRAYIGGVPAVFGYIVERHVAFDAKSHAVRIIGCGDTLI
jgi:hypothetical protein